MRRGIVAVASAAVLVTTLMGGASAMAQQSVAWTGNGLESVTRCVKGVDQPFLHWVLTPGGKPVQGTTAELMINGHDVGTMVSNGAQGSLQLTISVSPKLSVEKLEDATVEADITSGSVGDGAVLTISDGCLCSY
jgi:hypothetical protein